MSAFLNRIARIMATRGITQAELANSCGVSTPTISDYLNGKIRVTSKNLGKLLSGFHEVDDRLSLLCEYLKEQVPPDMGELVSIEPAGLGGVVTEPAYGDTSDWRLQVIQALEGLAPTTRDEIILIMERLVADLELRKIFRTTLDYLAGEEKRVIQRANKSLSQQSKPRASKGAEANLSAAAKTAIAEADALAAASLAEHLKSKTPTAKDRANARSG